LPMELFNGRVAVDDIDVVAISAATHHHYPRGSIPYKEFRAGKMPEIMPNSIKEDGEKGESINRSRVEAILEEKPLAVGNATRLEDGMFKGIGP